jgi:HAD superfamily hydrolase (TIGR01509 family)
MSHPARPSAVVFDLDGTLVDTVLARIQAWEAAFAERGIDVDGERLGPMIGMDGVRLAREILGTGTARLAKEVDRRAGALFDERNRNPRPLPGASEALARLDAAGITWAIATSSRAEQVSTSIGALDLDREPTIVDGSAVARAKPAPDLLRLAAERLGVASAECWYVGDSTWDMRAAVAAPMRPIAVLAGAAVTADVLQSAGADLVLHTLDELPIG